MTIKELEPYLKALTPSEKAQALQVIFAELSASWPGIEKNPDVCGGDACIVRTRIPVWLLAAWRRNGWTDQEILAQYPTLRPSDLANAWAYVSTHPSEIDSAIRDNDEDGAEA